MNDMSYCVRLFLFLSPLFFLLLSCSGPRGYIKGRYDQDVEKTNLLMDKWSESDMQNAVKHLVESALKHRSIIGSERPPVVMITRLQNKTSEHIDTQNIMDMVRVELMKSGQVSFIDKAARKDLQKEYEYQASGVVSSSSQKRSGNQIGADYIINGRLDSIVQQTGKHKTVYYKITLNLTNLSTSQIIWSDYKQIRKRYKKRRIGF